MHHLQCLHIFIRRKYIAVKQNALDLTSEYQKPSVAVVDDGLTGANIIQEERET
jgi:hypothetical protein